MKSSNYNKPSNQGSGGQSHSLIGMTAGGTMAGVSIATNINNRHQKNKSLDSPKEFGLDHKYVQEKIQTLNSNLQSEVKSTLML